MTPEMIEHLIMKLTRRVVKCSCGWGIRLDDKQLLMSDAAKQDHLLDSFNRHQRPVLTEHTQNSTIPQMDGVKPLEIDAGGKTAQEHQNP